ncbi:MAG TPA: alpha/beta hydrolase [Acidimicrobiales bacterium]|nr:alpha/beta hydrolase [Acidimicrobiales bacterium]
MGESGRVTIEEGVVFGTGGGRDLRCDVYRPPGQDGPVPGVLLVHGGSWRTGDVTQLRGYGIMLGRAGYVCVATEYRLLGESPWPAQIHDVKAAIRWMRANAGDLGIDPERIVVEGNSAGAHLGLLAAGTPGHPGLEGDGGNAGVPTTVAAAIGVYAPTLLTHGERRRGGITLAALSEATSEDEAALASPLTHVTPAFPPTMLIHGTDDDTVPVDATLVMYEALAEAGVACEVHLYAGQPHSFDAVPELGRQCAAEMLLFLDRYVRDRVPAPNAAG